MAKRFFKDLKNRGLKNRTANIDIDEFERIESKHTRVRHDEDLRENIRVH